ncbi:MAG: hypothetical protein EP320_10565 [Rhodobacteraceae bacterium]|nr:MAG: hypothetical protein EP320_10565 [Paracoccaceae bacterium]
MSAKVLSPCAWRVQGLDAEPHAAQLAQDICDVTVWLGVKYREPSIHLWVDRHAWQRGRQISGVHALAWHGDSVRILFGAGEVFVALGYVIEDTGAEIYAHPPCEAQHSRHAVLRAYARIEAALATVGLS